MKIKLTDTNRIWKSFLRQPAFLLILLAIPLFFLSAFTIAFVSAGGNTKSFAASYTCFNNTAVVAPGGRISVTTYLNGNSAPSTNIMVLQPGGIQLGSFSPGGTTTFTVPGNVANGTYLVVWAFVANCSGGLQVSSIPGAGIPSCTNNTPSVAPGGTISVGAYLNGAANPGNSVMVLNPGGIKLTPTQFTPGGTTTFTVPASVTNGTYTVIWAFVATCANTLQVSGLSQLCGIGSSTVYANYPIGFAYQGVGSGYQIFLWDLGSNRYNLGTTVDSTTAQQWVSFTVPASAAPGTNYYGFIGTSSPMTCKTTSQGLLTISGPKTTFVCTDADINHDGKVTLADLTLAGQYYTQTVVNNPAAAVADVNKDGLVNGLDFNVISKYYNQTCSTTSGGTIAHSKTDIRNYLHGNGQYGGINFAQVITSADCTHLGATHDNCQNGVQAPIGKILYGIAGAESSYNETVKVPNNCVDKNNNPVTCYGLLQWSMDDWVSAAVRATSVTGKTYSWDNAYDQLDVAYYLLTASSSATAWQMAWTWFADCVYQPGTNPPMLKWVYNSQDY